MYEKVVDLMCVVIITYVFQYTSGSVFETISDCQSVCHFVHGKHNILKLYSYTCSCQEKIPLIHVDKDLKGMSAVQVLFDRKLVECTCFLKP